MNSRQPGLILLDKPEGLTSFQTLSPIKRLLGTKKIGHCGTLDKFASGLMILLVEKGTKLVPLFTGMDKTYRAYIQFGSQTDTLDPEGRVVHEAPLPDLQVLEQVIPTFLGEISQIPPVYSAIHVQGRRAYERTRAGEELNLPPRNVVIHSIQVNSLSREYGDITIHCSKGTYIRSLCRDIALAAGSRATLVGLRRLSIGGISVDSSVPPDGFTKDLHLIQGRELVALVPHTGVIEINEMELRDLSHGKLNSQLYARAVQEKVKNPSWNGVFLLFGQEIWGYLDLEPKPAIGWLVPQGLV